MERTKILIFAGIGALAALVIYGAAATKTATHDDHRDRLARIEALMDEGGVKYRPSLFHRHRVETHAKLAGLEAPKASAEVAAPQVPAKDTKAEEAKKAADKKAADEKKKKEEEAKKKKKKKKKDDKTSEEAAPADAAKSSDDDKKKDDSANAGGLGGGLSAMPIAPFPSQDPNKLPQTVDEWIAYLFTNPSPEKTAKFIELAQVGTVTPAVFYPVTEKMLAATGRLPEYGVMAIGSLPNSQSFTLLADVTNETTLPDALKTQAEQYMNLYARIEYVRFLGTAVASTDLVAAKEALLLIQRSLTNLTSLTSVSSTSTSTTARTPASSLTIAKVYAQLEASLNAVAQSSSDGSVISDATQVAHQIAQQLQAVQALSTTAPTSTVATTTSTP